MSLITIDIKADMKPLMKRLNSLSNDLKDKVIVRSLNRVGSTTRTRLPRDAKARGYNINVGRIKADLSVNRANSGNMAYSIKASKKPISLKHYGAKKLGAGKVKQARNSKGQIVGFDAKKGGVSVRVKNSRSKLRHAFIGNGGHVFERKKTKSGVRGTMTGGFQLFKYKLKKLSGPSVSDMLNDATVERVTRTAISDNLTKEIASNINNLLR
jgi:hypothetical protein